MGKDIVLGIGALSNSPQEPFEVGEERLGDLEIPTELIEALRKAARVTALTGAGISAESGVPTFRDAQTGLWAKYRPEELATTEAFRRNPRLVWDWYTWRRERVAQAHPNPGHLALAEMEKRVPQFTLVTQNVDGLHRRAGSRNVIELHGNIMRTKCFHEDIMVEAWADTGETPPSCPHCGGPLRPDVVWFGEALPADMHLQLRKAGRLLAREEGQGTLEYVMLLSGVAIVLAVIFGIFVSIATARSAGRCMMIGRHRRRNFMLNKSGPRSLEFVATLPLYLLVFFLVLYFGLYMWMQIMAPVALHDGVRVTAETGNVVAWYARARIVMEAGLSGLARAPSPHWRSQSIRLRAVSRAGLTTRGAPSWWVSAARPFE